MKHFKTCLCLLSLVFLVAQCTPDLKQKPKEHGLRETLDSIVSGYHVTVGLAMIHLEQGDTLTLNGNGKYPMQSVYKFPLALCVLHQADLGKISLDQKIHLSKEDLSEDTWSPMKKLYPEGNIDVTIRQLLAFMVSGSDNIACDQLFRLMNGTHAVHEYVQGLGAGAITIAATEKEMHADWDTQFTNWCKPMTMSRLLEGLYQKKYLSDSGNALLLNLMTESSNSPMRIKGLLPEGTVVAHKTGTSGAMNDTLLAACNDVGIITLPNADHIALTVFLTNSHEPFEANEKLIAMLSKAVYDHYSKK